MQYYVYNTECPECMLSSADWITLFPLSFLDSTRQSLSSPILIHSPLTTHPHSPIPQSVQGKSWSLQAGPGTPSSDCCSTCDSLSALPASASPRPAPAASPTTHTRQSTCPHSRQCWDICSHSPLLLLNYRIPGTTKHGIDRGALFPRIPFP